MSGNFLAPDHSTRNLIVFSISLLIFIAFSVFYFIADNGCREYTDNLSSCTNYKCSQRVKGFQNKHLGHNAAILTREILGREKHEYFDSSTCNVIEHNKIENQVPMLCKYSDNTLKIVIERSGILFGTKKAPADADIKDLDIYRADHAKRTTEQIAECSKL